MTGISEKTMEKFIRSKVKTFLDTYVKDENEHKKYFNNIVVAGGCFASFLQGEVPNDYDLYFQDKEIAKDFVDLVLTKYKADNPNTTNFRVSNIKIENTETGISLMIKSSGSMGADAIETSYDYFEMRNPHAMKDFFNKKKDHKRYSLAMATSNALSFSDKVQLIIRFVGSPEYIVENFDFTHTKNYWTAKTGVVLNQASIMCIITKKLEYKGSMFPVCAMFRVRKFVTRGWHINVGEMFKIILDCKALDLYDPKVLKDQLTGVDQAYFNEVLEIIRGNSDKELNKTFLFTLMDQVFGKGEDEFHGLSDEALLEEFEGQNV